MGYVIDVCVFCGAHATWPFACGHRSRGWTIPIVVKPSPAVRRSLRQVIDSSEPERG